MIAVMNENASFCKGDVIILGLHSGFRLAEGGPLCKLPSQQLSMNVPLVT